MILSHDELIELTGKRTKPAQTQALKFMRIEYRMRPDGSPVVLRSHVEKLLGAQILSKPTSDFSITPDFSKVV
jgi:hypothetical protein